MDGQLPQLHGRRHHGGRDRRDQGPRGQSLRGGTYSIIPDQIEAGTYDRRGRRRGEVPSTTSSPKHLDCITAKLVEMGSGCGGDRGLHHSPGRQISPAPMSRPCPTRAFHRHAASDCTAVTVPGQGDSILNEGVWDNRYRYADEFRRMGANIQVNGKGGRHRRVESLTGAPVCLRPAGRGGYDCSQAAAHGVTEVDQVYHIERLGTKNCRKTIQTGATFARWPSRGVNEATVGLRLTPGIPRGIAKGHFRRTVGEPAVLFLTFLGEEGCPLW